MPDATPFVVNEFGQPVGLPVLNWQAPAVPERDVLVHRLVRLEPLTVGHADALHAAFAADERGDGWTYLAYGPHRSASDLADWINAFGPKSDSLPLAIIDPQSNRPVGHVAYLRISPPDGSVEIGHVRFAPALQRTPAGTAAVYLLIDHAFTLGYRRVEWKCDALNAPSRRAAARYGFTYEGTFRRATVYKGRTRDTAWFSITDDEWPRLKSAFEQWLAPENFAPDGGQQTSLADLTVKALAAS